MSVCHACHKDYPAGQNACPHCGVAARPTTGGSRTAQFGSQPPQGPRAQPTPAPAAASQTGSGGGGNVHAQAAVQMGALQMSDLAPGTVVSDYRVEGKLGEGGMGAVYSAVHPLIGKKAAIKVISPQLCTDSSSVERFVQEARSVNQIGHPNIVDIFTFGVLPDGRSYFVMEWLQGESLAERVARGGMNLAEAVEIMDQVADALEAAHEKGIVHRDLKPDNVYLVKVRGDRRLVKLLDFGIAKLASGDVRVQKTATGMMMGTPGYISPEQARGKNVDARTDVYAFGCMAYEMVLGRLPFVAESAMDVVLKHLTEPPPPPSSIWPEIPPGLEQILTRMLDKDPAQRPSLTEFRQILVELRGMLLSTMGPAGSQSFVSGFAARPVTPGTPMRMATPMPGSTPAIMRTPPSGMPVAQTGQTALLAAQAGAAAESMAPVKRPKGLVIAAALGVLALGGGAAAVFMGGGQKAAAPEAPARAPVTQPTPPPPVETPKAPPVEAPKAPPAPVKGTVVITVGPVAGTIEVDGKIVGTGTGVTIDLDEGEHQLKVTAPGMKPLERSITVASGARAEVPVVLDADKKSGGGKSSGTRPGGKTGDKPGGHGDGDKPGGGKPTDENYTIDPFTGQKIKK